MTLLHELNRTLREISTKKNVDFILDPSIFRNLLKRITYMIMY